MPEPIGGVQPFAELARNGPTVVYKGYQRDHDRLVLLKAVRSDVQGEDRSDRLAGEARLAAQVRHPNVVAVYETGIDGATAYLISEFVEGMDLRTLLARGPLPAPLAVYVGCEAAEGLRAVHASGILHRDLKPGNVLLSSEGSVKLADFGLASLAPEASNETRGTLAYLAPEVIRGRAPTPSADLFALGAVFVEMLTGRAAFARAQPSATLDAVLHHDPAETLAADPRVPTLVAELVASLLAKEPAARPPSAMHLVSRLEALGGEVGRAGADDLAAFIRAPETYVARRPAQRPPDVVPSLSGSPSGRPTSGPRRAALRNRIVAGVVALLLLAVLGYGATTGLEPNAEPDSVSDTAPADPSVEAAQRAPLPQSSDPAPLPVAERRDSEVETATSGPAAVPNMVDPTELLDAAPVVATDEAEEAGLERAEAEGEALPVEEAPTPATGTLSIAAEPWADVQIDGRPVGTTPLAALDLPVGTHTVSLRNPDFPVHTLDVVVTEQSTARVAVSLWELVGRVQLTVNPWARVSVDGAYWDTVPPQSRPLILAPGTRRLEFAHPTLGTRVVMLAVAPGEERSLRVDLLDESP